jgi:hypothetical protein
MIMPNKISDCQNMLENYSNKGKVKVKLSRALIEHHAIKA